MKKTLFGLIVFIFTLFFVQTAVFADTGTYKILDYVVKLTPKSDGSVEIEYYQKWLVTGGYIPWITVGTPNNNFLIVRTKSKGAIGTINPDNYNNWSGVKIGLNKDYRPNETFEISFAIIQNQLFYGDKENYQLDFTPGWYDRAETAHLRVEVFSFAKLDRVKARPEPTKIEGQSMVWEQYNLGRGSKYRIVVSFPRVFFPKPIVQGKPTHKIPDYVVPLVFIIIVIFFFVWSFRQVLKGGRYGHGGSIFYAGSPRAGRGGSLMLGKIFSGGGGEFGGRSFSCACACAGCACACACAGGGAAGCQRKLSHRYSLCKLCENKNICPIWKESVA